MSRVMRCLGVGRPGVDGAVGERVDYGELLSLTLFEEQNTFKFSRGVAVVCLT